MREPLPPKEPTSAMSRHLQRDMESVHREILNLSTMVEEMIDKAALALMQRKGDVAAEVIADDEAVDKREVRIEEDCLKILALHQPVAIDLRRIATVLKVNNDLERVADMAVNVAERAQSLCDYPDFPIPEKLGKMIALATQLVRSSMNAFVKMDGAGARKLLPLDDEVDAYNVAVIHELQLVMQKHSDQVPPALHCLSAARHVERIADLATNIAEDVIYLVEGDIVRHQHHVAASGG
jgi:phosphate transport system protein